MKVRYMFLGGPSHLKVWNVESSQRTHSFRELDGLQNRGATLYENDSGIAKQLVKVKDILYVKETFVDGNLSYDVFVLEGLGKDVSMDLFEYHKNRIPVSRYRSRS